MKVEIEIDELTSLKNSNAELKKKNEELDKKLRSLDEGSLIRTYEQKAKNAAYLLANNYLNLIAEKLGFEKANYYSPTLVLKENFEHWLGEEWWKKEGQINVEIEVRILNQWRRMFVNMGIISNS